MYDVAITGGGLSGLISAYLLAKQGLSVVLLEKKHFPFHRVCGEYISNEVAEFLAANDLFPSHLGPSQISRLEISAPNGAVVRAELDLGGFGISRYQFDRFLLEAAQAAGAHIHQGTHVRDVTFANDQFELTADKGKTFLAKIVVGAHGKRSTIDSKMNRPFFKKRSKYMGVKHHIRIPFPNDLIALHNFKGGYCGISMVEDGICNLCYLSESQNLKPYSNLAEMEQLLLGKNPFLAEIFKDAEFLFSQPLVINEVSFSPKAAVENHLLMVGDAAGLITPLCGNGMAMAIHGGKMASEEIIKYFERGAKNRSLLETTYQNRWKATFAQRLMAGRWLQRLFGGERTTNWAIGFLATQPQLMKRLIPLTHGSPLPVSGLAEK